MNEEILTKELRDGGPLYAETNLSNWIAEPWNGASALLFLAVGIFWFVKLRKEKNNSLWLYLALGILFLGGIGGSLYHAFRVSWWLLMMDVVPIYLLVAGAAFYFWRNITGKTLYAILVLTFFWCADLFIFYGTTLSIHLKNNLTYLNMALAISIPMIIWLMKTNFKQGWSVAIALGFYSLAIAFRFIDAFDPPVFIMGTHWLWHSFAAIGTGFFFGYLAKSSQRITS